MVVRDDQTIVPYGDTTLMAGDEILAVTSPQSKEVLKRIILGK
jgi:Trk K+ transport system NAD-binding subunit